MTIVNTRRSGYKETIRDSFRNYHNDGVFNALEKLIDINYNSNTITIGEEVSSIKEALDSITDNSETNRYVIEVPPGIYIEQNPIQGKSYVSIRSTGDNNTVRVIVRNPNEHLFLGANLFYLYGLSFYGVTGVDKYAVAHETAGEIIIRNCIVTDCSNGILINNVNSIVDIIDLALYTIDGSITNGITALAGNLVVDLVKVIANSTISKIIYCEGSSTLVTINNIISFSSNVTIGVRATNGARLSGYGHKLVGLYDGIVIDGNNTIIRFDAIQIINSQNDGFRIENVGTGIELALFATTITNSSRYNFNIENPNCVVSGSGFTEFDKSYAIGGSEIYAYILDTKEDDEGLNILGELHVGIPERPTESVFGGGDSYTRGMLVYTENPSNEFVNVSTEARSASGSLFSFTGVGVNNSIYIASSLNNGTDYLKFFGIKTKVDTVAVKGSGEIVTEYWNGSAWTEFNAMEIDSDTGYYPHAKNYFQDIGGHHIRFSTALNKDNWTKNDPMLLGTDYYWIRFRIKTEITTAPIFQQFKLHTNRSEINADGFIEYFGLGRPISQLPFSIGQDKAFEGNLGNQTLYISQNIGAGYQENSFNSDVDKIGRFFFVPLELDTSSPIELKIVGRSSGTGTIAFTVRWDYGTQGLTISRTKPAVVSPTAKSLTVSKSVTEGVATFYSFELDISNIISRREVGEPDYLGISIHSSSLGGLAFDLLALEANYTKWCQGGHI